VLTERDEDIQALAVSVVPDARTAGLVSHDVDPELDGWALFALATGLGSHMALYGASSAAARATGHHHLRRVAPHQTHHPTYLPRPTCRPLPVSCGISDRW
jgi:hypothetical protein